MTLLTSVIKKVINKFVNNEDIQKPIDDYYGNIPKHLEYPDYAIYELLEDTANKYPKNMAYQYLDRKVDYTKLCKKIENCAKSLIKLGVKPKDKVTICMPNTPEGIIMFYSVNMVGAVANMIHPLSSENEIEFYLKKSDSKFILTIDITYEKVLSVVKNTNVEKIILVSAKNDMRFFTRLAYQITKGRKIKYTLDKECSIRWDDFIKLGKKFDGIYKHSSSKDDDAVILYSGGTTGEPKGVVLSNLNFNALAMQSHLMCDPSKAGDSVLAIMPLFHGFGLGVCIHTPLCAGMSCILIPQFRARIFYKYIRKYKPNFLAGVPTMYEALIASKKKSKRYLKSVTSVISGGDILTLELRNKVNKYLSDHGSSATIRVGYGLTECTGASCLTPRFFYKEGSIGIPFPDTEYKIIKIGTLDEASVNKDGEICICGPTVMKHYLDDDVETNVSLKKHADGKIWLHTGDVGCMKSNGMIYFRTRLKRMIISSGYNIYPQYIEKILNTHPAVEFCCVVGIPHPYKQLVPKAYIVLKQGFEPSNKLLMDIKAHCEKSISKYALPYKYEFRRDLPKTLVGKIDIKRL